MKVDKNVYIILSVAVAFMCMSAILVYKKNEVAYNHTQESKSSEESWSVIQQREIDKLEDIAHHEGAESAWEYLKKTWGHVPIKAHYLAHVAGRLLYEEFGAQGFSLCDRYFSFGCVHGLLSELVKDEGEKGVISAKDVCYTFRSEALTGCIHGLGHGIMQWRANIPEALNECRKLGKKDVGNCFDGVYMEYDMDAMDMFPSKPTSTQGALWEFCDNSAEDAYPWCIRNHAFFLLAKRVTSTQAIVLSCEKLDKSAKDMCVSSIGILMADRKSVSNEDLIHICNYFADTDDVSHCLVSAAKEAMFQHRNIEKASFFCADLNEKWIKKCMNMIDNYGETYVPLSEMLIMEEEGEKESMYMSH